VATAAAFHHLLVTPSPAVRRPKPLPTPPLTESIPKSLTRSAMANPSTSATPGKTRWRFTFKLARIPIQNTGVWQKPPIPLIANLQASFLADTMHATARQTRRVVQARGYRPRKIVATTLAEGQSCGAQTQPTLLRESDGLQRQAERARLPSGTVDTQQVSCFS
jgi:hypothetical protein